MWLLLSILTAFLESLKDVFSKKGLETFDEYIIAWSLRILTLLFLFPLIFFIKLPSIGDRFWLALIVGGTLNVCTTILYMKAIKYSDLSITVPMVTFTPVFLLITSPIIVGEFPEMLGLLGVLLIVSGSYILNIKHWKRGVMAPFQALIKEKGPRLMLVVAFIWSITSNFDKVGIQNSSVLFWILAINCYSTLLLTPIVVFNSRRKKKVSKGSRSKGNPASIKNLKKLLPIGFFAALRSVSQMLAINLTLVAYVISIKRTSVLFSIVFAYLIFKEKGIRERISGAILMILGVCLITLS